MASTPNLTETLKRMVEIEKEASLKLGYTVSAVPRFVFTPEVGMYWTNRIGTVEFAEEWGEELEGTSVELIARFIVEKVTANIVGDNEFILYEMIPYFADFLNEREMLQSTTYPSGQLDLEWARVMSCSGYTEFTDNASGVVQAVGTEFTIRLSYRFGKTQAYTG